MRHQHRDITPTPTSTWTLPEWWAILAVSPARTPLPSRRRSLADAPVTPASRSDGETTAFTYRCGFIKTFYLISKFFLHQLGKGVWKIYFKGTNDANFVIQYPSFIVHQSSIQIHAILMHNKWRILYFNEENSTVETWVQRTARCKMQRAKMW